MADSFRRDSYRNPQGVPQDSGYGSGYGNSEGSLRETHPSAQRPRGIRTEAGRDLTQPQQAEARSKARRDTAWRWAADNLPDRETALAAGAYLMLTRHGSKTTPQAVAARLDRTYGERSFKRFYEDGVD